MKRIFVMIRDKLGDSVIAFQALSAYREAHPEQAITVMVHAHYLPLFEHEKGYCFVPYRSNPGALLWALWQRLLGRRYDALLLLRGFGEKMVRFARYLPADRRIHALNRFPEVFVDSAPALPREQTEAEAIVAPSMRGLRQLDPGLVAPERLSLPGLSGKYRRKPSCVVVCPVSDEARKNLSPDDVRRLLPLLHIRHPGLPIRVLVRNDGEGRFVVGVLDDAEVVAFGAIKPLLTHLGEAAAYYGCDTGLYHVAAAMDIPATVFFGPTQPYKVLLPRQSVKTVRLAALGQAHCDNKACRVPACIDMAVGAWCGQLANASPLPDNCPLASATELHRLLPEAGAPSEDLP